MAAAIERARNSATLREPEWWRQMPAFAPTISGQTVTPETALAVTAVYACVLILAESVASLPLSVYRRLPNGGKEVATNHPVHQLLHVAPNDEQTAFEAIEYRMACLGLRGNAYSALTINGRGDIRDIQPLRPQHMRLDRDAAGRLVFDYQEPGAAKVYPKNLIWYTRGFGTDGVTGLSPIGVHREAIGYAMTLNEHGNRMFANGAMVGSTIEVPVEWSETAFQNFKADFKENHGGRLNANKPLILEAGAKFNTIGMSLVDAEYIASLKNAIAEVARIYRIPLHMLNELENATFSNIEHQSLEFVTRTLLPWLKRIEDSANRDLFGPLERGTYYVKFNVDALLRGDIKSRYEAYQIAVGGNNGPGWMARNEVRVLEDMDPLPGLDEIYVPAAPATPKPGDPTAEKPQKAGNKLPAIVKALRIERERRTDDSNFHGWASDYLHRMCEGTDTNPHDMLDDLQTLGVEGAIDQWLKS
jgi:HK97 family phage portal protein